MSILGKSNKDKVYLSRKFKLDASLVRESFDIKLDALSRGRIPEKKGVILLCNRPIGALEELLIQSILPEHLHDEMAFHSNPFLSVDDDTPNVTIIGSHEGLLEESERLRDRVNIFFPAGILSKRRNHRRSRVDGRWNRRIVRQLLSLDLPIIPVLIEGRVRTAGQVLSSFHSVHRTTQILVSSLQQEKNTVNIRLGRSIQKEHLESLSREGNVVRFLRSKLFSLGTAIHVDDYFNKVVGKKVSLANSVRKDVLQNERSFLNKSACLAKHGDYHLYLFYALDAPNWIQEIGRLRELNDRLEGKENGQTRKLDEFDLHYEHLALWDESEQRIVAACRIGDGKRVFATHGKSGLSFDEHFRINPSLDSQLKKSLDIGHFYLDTEIKKDYLPLSLLWSGLALVIMERSHVKFVSASIPLQRQTANDAIDQWVNSLKDLYSDEAYLAYLAPRTSSQLSKSFGNKSSAIPSPKRSTHGLIDLPAPPYLLKCLERKAKLLGLMEGNQKSNETYGLFWIPVDDLPRQLFDEAATLIPKED